MSLSVGQTLQRRYQIQRLLGQGGMGAVYLAEDLSLGRRCAVKENIPDPQASPQVLAQMRQQFRAEAQVLANLDHPNLPRVHDFFSHSGNEYMVMEYVEGEDLHSLLQRQGGPLPEQAVLAWADQVLDALAYLHSQQPHPIIHRDIKPANIILTPQDKVKLVDFGLVKLLDPNDPRTATVMKGMGTPEYAPLEQYASGAGHTDARSDIYSLGGTLYHLLTGTPPPDVHQRLLDPSQMPAPRRLNPRLAASTDAALLKALEIYPSQRLSSAVDMRQALVELPVGGASVSSRAAKGGSRRVRPAWPLLAVGALAAIVILTLALRGDGGQLGTGVVSVETTFAAVTPLLPTDATMYETNTSTPRTGTPVPLTDTPGLPTHTPLPLTNTPVVLAVPRICPDGSPSLTMWADSPRALVLRDLRDHVLAETGVCLIIQEVGFGDIRTKVALTALAGDGPDVFLGAHDWLGELHQSGVVAEINLGSKAADFDPVALQAFTLDGRLVGMPLSLESVALICNSDLVPEPPTTYDQVRIMSLEMRAAGTVSQFLALFPNDAYHYEPINTAFGGYVFSQTDDGYVACDVGLDNQGAINSLTWIDGMVKDGLLRGDLDWETAHVLFESKNAACLITGPWALDRFRNAGITYTVSAVPSQVQQGSPFVGVQGFMINAFSPNRSLAEAVLVDYVATSEVMEAVYETTGRPPAYLPARESVNLDTAAFANAAARGHPMPAIPAMNEVWSAWGDAIGAVFRQSETPLAAASGAAQQIRAFAGCR